MCCCKVLHDEFEERFADIDTVSQACSYYVADSLNMFSDDDRLGGLIRY